MEKLSRQRRKARPFDAFPDAGSAARPALSIPAMIERLQTLPAPPDIERRDEPEPSED
jgi:hypothetical protein